MAKLSLHWKIIIGMLLGTILGLSFNSFGWHILWLEQTCSVVGDLFIRLLRFVAVPIVLFSLIVGAGGLGDIKKLGKLGFKTFFFYLSTTAIAISIGLLLANLFSVGGGLDPNQQAEIISKSTETVAAKIQKAEAPSFVQTLLNIIPNNPFAALAEGNMLQIVFFSLSIGMGLNLLSEEKRSSVLSVADTLTDVFIRIVQGIMQLAPYAVAALIFKVFASLGLSVFVVLLKYCLVVVLGLSIMIFGVYLFMLRIWTNIGPLAFLRGIAPAQLLAFSSASSSATMPITLQCVQQDLGVEEDVSSFVIPLGATINMDGTALYQGVAAVFIAQMYHLPLQFSDQLTIVLTATLASIGTAGVPGVGMIMLVIVLQSVGMTPEMMTGGLAMIFGVDRILDMCRTVCNVTGDCAVAVVVGNHHKDVAE